jgi:hypothetical protein
MIDDTNRKYFNLVLQKAGKNHNLPKISNTCIFCETSKWMLTEKESKCYCRDMFAMSFDSSMKTENIYQCDAFKKVVEDEATENQSPEQQGE